MLSITNTNLLTILFRERIASDSGNYKKYVNTGALCGQKYEFLNVEVVVRVSV
jgi:hypothetical protein